MIVEHGTIIWFAIALAGLASWALVGVFGIIGVARVLRWADNPQTPRSHAWVYLSMAGLLSGMLVLFMVYLLVIGALSITMVQS
jgi:hypothetical protein